MNEDSAGAKSHYINEINDALAAAERLTQNNPSVDMVTVAETSGNNAEGNWLYAVGGYRTWAKGTAKHDCNDNYELQWSFNFRDNYDWKLNNGLDVTVFGIMIVSDREMALLHRYGVAREYEMIGEQKVVVKWKKGQRFESGAKVSDGEGRR
jgi:hypothetical protein